MHSQHDRLPPYELSHAFRQWADENLPTANDYPGSLDLLVLPVEVNSLLTLYQSGYITHAGCTVHENWTRPSVDQGYCLACGESYA